jgi:transcription initiation factor TFIID subunit TAF12
MTKRQQAGKTDQQIKSAGKQSKAQQLHQKHGIDKNGAASNTASAMP